MVRSGRGRCARMVAALVGMTLLGAVGAGASTLGQDRFKPGDVAPDFETTDLKGAPVKLSTYKGKKVVLLNFWGIRCGACLEEMPYLDAIGKKHAGKDLVILGVDTDGVDAETILATLKEVKVSVGYPLLLDQEFAITDAYTNFLVPLTIVIDRAGIVRYIHTGFEKGREAEYEAAVLKALGS